MNAKTTMEQVHHVWAMIHRHIVDKKKTCLYSSISLDDFYKVGVIRENTMVLLQFSILMQKPIQLHWNSLMHGLNIFVYYPSVLSNVVVFFSQSTSASYNKVTELVHSSYILHSNSPPVALEVETVSKQGHCDD